MTDQALSPQAAADARLKRRYNAERRFKFYGQAAIFIAVSFLAILLFSIFAKASSAFSRHMVEVTIDQQDFAGQPEVTVTDLNLAVRQSLEELFPQAMTDPAAKRDLYALTTRLAVLPVQKKLAENPQLAMAPITASLALADDLDLYLKNEVSRQTRFDVGKAGRFIRTEDGFYRVTESGPDGVTSLSDRLGQSDTSDLNVLITVGTAWFELRAIEGAALVLAHLAGPIPDLGEQGDTPIRGVQLRTASSDRKVSNRQIAMALHLKEEGRLRRSFNQSLFSNADSTYPELAGAAAALLGSLFTMLTTALFALPIGILAAVYLEEFAPKSVITNIIEVNINNLAAVPSIIFGLLGAAVFLNAFGLPRSVPLVGGLVLGLLVLPTIIIAARAALRSVPPSVRDAALGLGASKSQAVFHHVLPLATPGILTGAIIAMARALGETAPLLLIGMVAFISDVPNSPTDESTVLPVLIYKWFSGAERAWEPMTAAVIVMLLTVLVAMNLVAALLRRRFERKW